ncbi:MAG: CheY-like chemotaxis protein, partial [Bacteriovoracaceae bacterium]
MIQIKNKSILLVDDNEEILTMVRTFIEFDFEVEIIEAKSGNQAIELLKEENNFGLIISDHQMPNGSGEDLFKYVEKNIEIPFILSSGNLPTSDLKEAILAHNPSNKILVKPFNFEVLLSELENILNDSNDESEEKYAKIPLHFFMNHQDYKNEVFIRTGENKFVKIVNAGDSLDIEQAERFQEKSVSHLYMEKNSSIEYLNMIFETILKDSPS